MVINIKSKYKETICYDVFVNNDLLSCIEVEPNGTFEFEVKNKNEAIDLSFIPIKQKRKSFFSTILFFLLSLALFIITREPIKADDESFKLYTAKKIRISPQENSKIQLYILNNKIDADIREINLTFLNVNKVQILSECTFLCYDDLLKQFLNQISLYLIVFIPTIVIFFGLFICYYIIKNLFLILFTFAITSVLIVALVLVCKNHFKKYIKCKMYIKKYQ